MGPEQLESIERWNLIFAGILILASAILFDRAVAVGVTVGALLSAANFYGIRRLWQAALRNEGQKRQILQILMLGKMVGLMVLVFLAIKYLPLNPVALAIGMSTFLLSIAVESVRFALKENHG